MDSNHEILGFVVPTNEPDVAFRYLLSSLDGLKEAAPISTFLFNFQEPWTNDQVVKAVEICESYGFAVRYTFNSYEIKGKGLVPFNQIRGDACSLMPEARFFMLMDDDFSFIPNFRQYKKSAGEAYVDLVYYMITHPRCGSILIKGRAGTDLSSIGKYKIQPYSSLNIRCITDRGILQRNIDPSRGLIVPNDALGLVGSDEEKVSVAWRIKEGYYPATINRFPSQHYENCSVSDTEKATPGYSMYSWNRRKILDANANKYIKENFYPEFVNKGSHSTVLGDYNDYRRAGGPDISDETINLELTLDISLLDNSLKEVIDYYERGGAVDV